MLQPTDVIVYSSTHCQYCARLKSYLKDQNIAYEERNVDLNDKYAEELWNTGMRSVPVTVIGETKILGFNPTQLQKALAHLQN